ncbi:MAG: glutamine amidotransferase-related protein [Pseudomonadota bacterium]
MKFVSVVQHCSAEYLGFMEDHLEGRRVRFKYFRPFTEGTPLPHPDAIGDALILLGGGPWGSAGGRDLPTLKAEINLATTCLMLEKPVIGIGLGAQILSLAAGGRVSAAPLCFTIGEATRVAPHALNGYLPARYPHIVYMRDWPEPPAYAQVLARGPEGRPALFQIGETAFGFVGHPGFKRAMAEDLLMEFGEAPPAPDAALAALHGLAGPIQDALVPIMTGLVQCTGLMAKL